ncbi:PREDICTED: uncharacterized protein LOC108749202 isoform X2 [Trachymyrmex septentrionalis]|uniref:uncharacterized protein LOC108749202 isoform X2 n=1 Tax=Trachymyrmex septentrionalis TaxID=34720 RepID=UPI00084F2554|nr:PREDICTED: uncharacterized protein LOC108749202 isoform X2 [Trachymyrmex septentrionalis]
MEVSENESTARRLYIRCMPQTYQMSDFKTYQMRDFVVFSRISTGDSIKRISGHHERGDLNVDDNEAMQNEDSDNDITEDDTSDWKTWTNTIYATAQDIIGIMRPHFGIGSTIATASSVELELDNLKNRSFKNQLSMRIDKFVLQHLDHLEVRKNGYF